VSLLGRLWARRRDSPWLVALAGLTLGVILVWPLVDPLLNPAFRREMSIGEAFAYYDFGAYSGGVDRWLDGGAIYLQGEEGGYRGSYLYPPVSLLFFAPFYFLAETSTFDVGATSLGAVSLVLLWVGLEAVVRELGYEFSLAERLVTLVALFGFQPVLFDFHMGQVGTALAAVLCFAFYAHERHRRTGSRFYGLLSGVLTTAASGFKLFYATSGAHLLRSRVRFAAALGAAGGFAVFSVALFGADVHLTYLDVLAWGKGWGEVPRAPQLWGPAYYRPLYVLGSSALFVRLLGVLAVVGLTVAARDAPVERETFALGVAVIPLFAPVAYTQDLVVLLLPAVVLLATELERDGGWPAVPVLAVLLLHVHAYGLHFLTHPPGWLPLGEAVRASAGWLQPGAWGTLLLVGLAATRVADHASLSALDARAPSGARGD
jgi:alpha-1,2-mannosyltransferase